MEGHKPATSHVLYDREAAKKRETWLKENQKAIEVYNEHVAQHGVFSTGLRGF